VELTELFPTPPLLLITEIIVPFMSISYEKIVRKDKHA